MPKRKRHAAIKDNPIGSVIVGGHASVDEEELHRVVLQPRPNPPRKSRRPNKQSGEKKPSSGLHKTQKRHHVENPSIATAISLPPEIWILIGETLSHPKTLSSLVRVSRAFYDIFTPILHSRRIINLEYFTQPPEDTQLPPYLEYLQDFHINIYQFTRACAGYEQHWTDQYAAWVAKALESTKCLRSFTWRDNSCDDNYSSAFILQSPDVLRSLKAAENLKHICISFEVLFTANPETVEHCYFPLNGFQNLVSLELYDFYRDYNVMVKELASFLCKSPLLKKLGLGFACERTLDDYDAAFLDAEGRDTEFLERLCDLYASKCKTGPLPLKTLRLGCGIYLSNPSNLTNDYLAKLLDLGSLEVLHIHNGLVSFDVDDDPFYREIDLTLLPSKECTSLRQLSVSRLGKDIIDWLNEDGNCVSEVFVMDHYDFNEKDLERFSKLPCSRLSTIWTQEKYPLTFDELADWDEWSDEESWASDESIPEHMNSETSDLDVNGLSGITAGAPNVDSRFMTVLDRLPNGGSHLEKLCISLDFEAQWWFFLLHLKNLNKLKQLRLNPKSWRAGDYPSLASSIWLGITEKITNLELARRFAHVISSMCPSLCYIKIGHDLACEIIRPKLSDIGIRTRSQASIRLRDLDRDEILEIELFALMMFTEQAGLPTQECNREEKELTNDPQTLQQSGVVHSVHEWPLDFFP